MVYLGIDPGKSGGLAVITDSNDIVVTATPVTKENEIDIAQVNAFIDFIITKYNTTDIQCVLEDVHSIFGMSAQSNFQFGRVLGVIEGILGSRSISFIKVTPKVWQKEIWAGTTPIGNATGKLLKSGAPHIKIDTKGTSLLVAKQLFPDVNLLATPRSKVAHDGIVDALLIAEYCKRKFKQ